MQFAHSPSRNAASTPLSSPISHARNSCSHCGQARERQPVTPGQQKYGWNGLCPHCAHPCGRLLLTGHGESAGTFTDHTSTCHFKNTHGELASRRASLARRSAAQKGLGADAPAAVEAGRPAFRDDPCTRSILQSNRIDNTDGIPRARCASQKVGTTLCRSNVFSLHMIHVQHPRRCRVRRVGDLLAHPANCGINFNSAVVKGLRWWCCWVS